LALHILMVRPPLRKHHGVERDDPHQRPARSQYRRRRDEFAQPDRCPARTFVPSTTADHSHRSHLVRNPHPLRPAFRLVLLTRPLRRGRRGAPTVRALAVPPGAAPAACSGRLETQPRLGSPRGASSATSTGSSRADRPSFAPPAVAVHQTIGGRVARHEPSRLPTFSLPDAGGITWTPRIHVAPRSRTGGRSQSSRGRPSPTENLRTKRPAAGERRGKLDGPRRWRHPSSMVRAPQRNCRGLERDDPRTRTGAILTPPPKRRVRAAGPVPCKNVRSEHHCRSPSPVAFGPEPSSSSVLSDVSNVVPLRRGRRGR